MTLEELRVLTSMQAEDEALWAPAVRIEVAYVQQALRLLTKAIDGELSFQQVKVAIEDCLQ